ncbi:MAG: translation initiation factor IF-2 [Desulfobacteraceae bacterium]|nr:translation initiation factor IF-2 [Desulfobacteraceae bacterium]
MAKVRVYELARELDIESNKMVEKLVSGGMNIKNYMSTLDEEAVAKAKEIVSGTVSEIIEEKRIKPTVIRRRKKIKIEQEIPTAEIEEEAKDVESEALKQEMLLEETKVQEGAVEGMEVAPSDIPPKAEKREGAPEEVSHEEQIAEKEEAKVHIEKVAKKTKAKVKKAKKRKVDKPARIIRLPEEGPLKDALGEKVDEKVVELHPLKPITFKPIETVTKEEKGLKGPKPAKRKRTKEKAEEEVDISRHTLRYKRKEIYERSDLYGGRSIKPKRKKIGKKPETAVKKGKQTEITVPKAIKRRIKVQEFVTVAELAKAMGAKATDLVKKLMGLGVAANINVAIDFESASVVADDLGYELELDTFKEERLILETEDRPEDLEPRPPVVTIMGHVDHGKTSLLDYIRESNIIGGESGGITQHIGAYYVKTKGGDIVFLDTPGHEAFTAMRARGAKVTDLIVLVVAADDGAMSQTKEAINHARAANVPIVVAINKIDKPEADPEKVKRELAELDLAPEEWGGETIYGHISAKTGEGVDEMLGLILLQSEILELKGNPKKAARGAIIEAHLDKSKGPVASVLIKNGTLRQGDHFICGDHYGRVRAMLNQQGKKMKSAGPSVPVEIYGISGVPMAGDEFIVVQDEKTARQVIGHRRTKRKKPGTIERDLVSLDDFFERMKEGDVKELNIVLKTDVQGSLEALTDSLVKQSTEEVKLRVIHSATGGISESDVMLASASDAIIIGFNVRANPRVSNTAEKEKVDIRYYDVIYKAIKDVRLAMTGLLEPVYEEHIIGRADIKETFHIPKVGSVAGCYVTDGYVERNANVRVLRDDVVVIDDKVTSLRRFKEQVKEVQSGYECGIGLENFQDFKTGDVFEFYKVEEMEAEL